MLIIGGEKSEKSNIFEKVKQERTEAQTEAQNIIEHINPEDISGWNNLIRKLEIALKRVKKVRKHLRKTLN